MSELLVFERQLEDMPTASSTTNFSKASGLKHCRMEVDLLGVEAHIAIELDGAQHLENAEAYRRDRRKDVLLQEKLSHLAPHLEAVGASKPQFSPYQPLRFEDQVRVLLDAKVPSRSSTDLGDDLLNRRRIQAMRAERT